MNRLAIADNSARVIVVIAGYFGRLAGSAIRAYRMTAFVSRMPYSVISPNPSDHRCLVLGIGRPLYIEVHKNMQSSNPDLGLPRSIDDLTAYINSLGTQDQDSIRMKLRSWRINVFNTAQSKFTNNIKSTVNGRSVDHQPSSEQRELVSALGFVGVKFIDILKSIGRNSVLTPFEWDKELSTHSPEAYDEIACTNEQFHRTIAEAANSAKLTALIAVAVDVGLVARTYHLYSEAALLQSCQHHHEMVDAIEAHSPQWAESVMTSHLLAAQSTTASAV